MKQTTLEDFEKLPDGTPYFDLLGNLIVKGTEFPILLATCTAEDHKFLVLEKEDIDKILFGLHKAHLDATNGDVQMNFGIVRDEKGKTEVRVTFTRLLNQLQLSPENAKVFCSCIMEAVKKIMGDGPRLLLPGRPGFDA